MPAKNATFPFQQGGTQLHVKIAIVLISMPLIYIF